MKEEIIQIYDKENKPIGCSSRTNAHKKGLWHRTIHIWIYNLKGEILIQKRSREKIFYPGKWDISIAGHLSCKEKILDTAAREVREEIGLKIKKEDLKFVKIKKIQEKFRNIKNKEFAHIYSLKIEKEIKNPKLQKEEVQKIKFISIKKLKKELKENKNKFVDYGKSYWKELIKEIKINQPTYS
jgi:isopentenyl-diphosphate Delta-isomerase